MTSTPDIASVAAADRTTSPRRLRVGNGYVFITPHRRRTLPSQTVSLADLAVVHDYVTQSWLEFYYPKESEKEAIARVKAAAADCRAAQIVSEVIDAVATGARLDRALVRLRRVNAEPEADPDGLVDVAEAIRLHVIWVKRLGALAPALEAATFTAAPRGATRGESGVSTGTGAIAPPSRLGRVRLPNTVTAMVASVVASRLQIATRGALPSQLLHLQRAFERHVLKGGGASSKTVARLANLDALRAMTAGNSKRRRQHEAFCAFLVDNLDLFDFLATTDLQGPEVELKLSLSLVAASSDAGFEAESNSGLQGPDDLHSGEMLRSAATVLHLADFIRVLHRIFPVPAAPVPAGVASAACDAVTLQLLKIGRPSDANVAALAQFARVWRAVLPEASPRTADLFGSAVVNAAASRDQAPTSLLLELTEAGFADLPVTVQAALVQAAAAWGPLPKLPVLSKLAQVRALGVHTEGECEPVEFSGGSQALIRRDLLAAVAETYPRGPLLAPMRYVPRPMVGPAMRLASAAAEVGVQDGGLWLLAHAAGDERALRRVLDQDQVTWDTIADFMWVANVPPEEYKSAVVRARAQGQLPANFYRTSPLTAEALGTLTGPHALPSLMAQAIAYGVRNHDLVLLARNLGHTDKLGVLWRYLDPEAQGEAVAELLAGRDDWTGGVPAWEYVAHEQSKTRLPLLAWHGGAREFRRLGEATDGVPDLVVALLDHSVSISEKLFAPDHDGVGSACWNFAEVLAGRSGRLQPADLDDETRDAVTRRLSAALTVALTRGRLDVAAVLFLEFSSHPCLESAWTSIGARTYYLNQLGELFHVFCPLRREWMFDWAGLAQVYPLLPVSPAKSPLPPAWQKVADRSQARKKGARRRR